MSYVYLLQSPGTRQIYIGLTGDLRRRMREHQQLERHKGWRLIYYEAYLTREEAAGRERMLKHYGSAKQGLLRRLKRSLGEPESVEGVE